MRKARQSTHSLVFSHHSGLLFKKITIVILENSTSVSKDDAISSSSNPDADNTPIKYSHRYIIENSYYYEFYLYVLGGHPFSLDRKIVFSGSVSWSCSNET